MIAMPGIMVVAVALFGAAVIIDVGTEQRACYDTPPTVTPVCSEPVKNCERRGEYLICEEADT